MKKTSLTILLTILSASVALAAWQDNFQSNYQNEGIDKAVIAALEEGIAPEPIVVKGQTLDGLSPQNLLKALYCAGADGNDISKAARDAGISEQILTAAYEKSITECQDQMTDTQALTSAAQGPNFYGMPTSRRSSGAPYASHNTL